MSVDTALGAVVALERLYASGFRDSVTDAVLRKTLASQISREQTLLRELERDLSEFENQYGMSSEVFFDLWEAGELDDTADLMEWNGLYRMTERSRERLRLMTVERTANKPNSQERRT